MFQPMLDRLFRDSEGKIVIWQWPNAPLWAWIASTVLGYGLHGTPKILIGYIGSAALYVWAMLELTQGITLFRRILGSVVMVVLTISIFSRLLR